MIRPAAPLAAVLLLLAAPAAAQPLDPCARFEEPLAYNAGLAQHGPRALGTLPAAADEQTTGPHRRSARGRQRLEFSVGGD